MHHAWQDYYFAGHHTESCTRSKCTLLYGQVDLSHVQRCCGCGCLLQHYAHHACVFDTAYTTVRAGNDSCYVNAAAALNLHCAANFSKALGVTPGANWTQIADNVRIPFDEAREVRSLHALQQLCVVSSLEADRPVRRLEIFCCCRRQATIHLSVCLSVYLSTLYYYIILYNYLLFII